MVTACAAAGADLVGEGKNPSDTTNNKTAFEKAAVGYGAVFQNKTANPTVTDKCITSYTINSDGAVTALTYVEGSWTVTFDGTKYTATN